MSQRKAPYKHADGSNCWTENCSRGHTKPLPSSHTADKYVFKTFRVEPIFDHLPAEDDYESREYSALEYGSPQYNEFIYQASVLSMTMTREENEAAYSYTDWGYKELYTYLEGKDRQGKAFGYDLDDEEYEQKVNSLNLRLNALDSLVNKGGDFRTPITVFRGEQAPEGVDLVTHLSRTYPMGEKVKVKRYLSTSLEPQVALDIKEGSRTNREGYMVVVEAKRGAALGDDTSIHGLREREILLPRDQEYEVKAISVNTFIQGYVEKSVITVHLKQL